MGPDLSWRPRIRRSGARILLASCCGMLMAGAVWAQGAPVGGTYMCVDAQGRSLTSDRPIPACADREQKVLGPSGTVIRRIGPTMNSHEQEAQQARERAEARAQQRLLDEKRRDRALLMRYPNQGAHDRERAEALARIVANKQAAGKRIEELGQERRKVDLELEFYKGDLSKAPRPLRLQAEAITTGVAEQERYIAAQDDESRRINAQFDDELGRLRRIWAMQPASNKPSP